jgi:hypothetical protein
MKLNKILLIVTLNFLVITTFVYAQSQNYYARTDVYFNIPYDAAFRIAMPSGYTYVDITGTDYATATATSPSWISFNFTQVPQSYVQPYAGGLAGDAQDGITKPIFRYDPTGNTPIRISINLTSIPSGITVKVNGTCDDVAPENCTNPLTTETTLVAGVEQVLVESLAVDNYFNVTLWGSADITATPGEYGPVILYHHSTVA